MSISVPVRFIATRGTPARLASGGVSVVPCVSGPAQLLSLVDDGNATPIVINQATDSATTDWVNAVVAAGGTVSDNRAAIVNNFITRSIADGTWARYDDCGVLAGEGATQALMSLKQLRLATAVAAPTFTANRGYTFDGTASYIATGFIPSTHMGVGTLTSARLAVYERTNIDAARASLGTRNGAANALNMRARSANNAGASVNSDFVLFGTVTDSRGLSAVSRDGSTWSLYKSGGLSTTFSPTAGTTLPTFDLYVGAMNNAGAPSGFRPSSAAFWSIGAAMSAAQERADYRNVQALLAAIGAQV